MATSRRNTRTNKLTSADVHETDQEMEDIIDNKPASRRRRPSNVTTRPARKQAPAKVQVVLPQARHVEDYTVDLTNEGEDPTRDFAKVLAKEPSETNLRFVEWVRVHVGVDIDPKTVQILISTYHEFQNSPESKAVQAEKRLAAAEKKALREANKKAKPVTSAKV